MRKLFIRPLLLILIALNALPPAAASDAFSAQTLSGEAVQLAEFFEPDKWTLVMIWTTYCEVCARQFPLIDALHRSHHETLLKVIGVAVDGSAAAAKVRAELARRNVSFDSLIAEIADTSAAVMRATGEPFSGTPTYLLFNPAGEIAARVSGALAPDAIVQYIAAHAH